MGIKLNHRLFRLGKYSIWTFLDQLCLQAPLQLGVFPLLAWLLGSKDFGALVLAVAFINLVGMSPSHGFHGYVLREAAKYSQKEQALIIRTMAAMSFVFVLPAGLFFAFGSSYIGEKYNLPLLGRFLPVLGAYLVLLNVTDTLLVAHRIRREFGIITFVHGVQGLAFFSAIPLYLICGINAVPYGWLIAALISVLTSCLILRKELFARPLFSRFFAKQAMGVWAAFSVSAFVLMSAGKIDRLLLGYWWDTKVVATFFAAVGTAAIFVMPAQFFSTLILSLLGKVSERETFSRKFYSFYAIGACLFTLAAFCVGSLCGKLVLNTFYPSLADNALPLWKFAVASFAILNVQLLCRPFIVKFLSIKLIPVLTTINVIGRLLPILILVPSRGQRGAVEALLIGSTVASISYFSVYLRSFVFRKSIPAFQLGENRSAADVMNTFPMDKD